MKETREILNPLGIIAIHASAVEIDGQAHLFLGPSGTGKSTIVALLSGYARPLADDKVYIIPRENVWQITDASARIWEGPLSEEDIDALSWVRLSSVIRLQKSSELHLCRSSSAETCSHLAEAFFELFWQRQSSVAEKKAAFRSLAAVARCVRGYYLDFNRSVRAFRVLQRCFED